MKIGKKLKRICAAAMASVIGLTGWQILLPDLVEAADNTGYYVNFVNLDAPSRPSLDGEIVAGEYIKTVAKIPENHSYTNPNFRIVNAVTDTSALNPLPDFVTVMETDNSNGQTSLRIRAKELHGKDYDKQITYSLAPVFNATLTKSSTGHVVGWYKELVNGAPEDKMETRSVTATAVGVSFSVIEPSSITFIFPEGTATSEPGYQYIGADSKWGYSGPIEIKDATGGLAQYKTASNAVVTAEQMDQKTLRLSFNIPGDPASNKVVDVEMTNTVPYLSGTEITLEFNPQAFDELRLTVIPRKEAVNKIVTNIQSEVNKYIRFTQAGDSTESISGNFYLTRLVQRYNFDSFVVDWEWYQDDKTESDCVDIQTSTGKERLAKVTRPYKDVTGVLRAKVIHTSTLNKDDVVSSEIEIPVTILGRGVDPSVYAKEQIVGFFNEEEDRKGEKRSDLTYDNFPDMEVYDGSVKGWPPAEKGEITAPFRVVGLLNFGSGVKAAHHARIELTRSDVVDFYLDSAPTKVYVPGTDILNPDMRGPEYVERFEIVAKGAGTVGVRISFYDEAGSTSPYYVFSRSIHVNDNSPSPDARMKTIDVEPFLSEEAQKDQETVDRFNLVYPTGKDEYVFQMDEFNYELPMPWVVDKVRITPTYNHLTAYDGDISISWTDGYKPGSTLLKVNDIISGNVTYPEIDLTVGLPMQVVITGTAEDKTTSLTYYYTITRLPKSDIAFLGSLSAVTQEDKVERIENPDLEMKFDYSITLPYSYHGKPIVIEAYTQDNWAKKPVLTVDPPEAEDTGFFTRLRKLVNSGRTVVRPAYDWNKETGAIKNVTRVYIDVESESGVKIRYTVGITIEDPSRDNDLAQLDVYRPDTDEPLSFDNKVVFAKEGLDYYLTIPYSTERLRFEMLPNDEKSTDVWLQYPEVYRVKEANKDGWVGWTYSLKGTPISRVVDVPFDDPIKDNQKKFDFRFDVTAESEENRDIPYTIHIERADPDIDARLASMTVTDGDTEAPVENFSFNPQKLEYDFTVPFTTTNVVVTPVAQSALSKVMVDDAGISETYPGRTIQLREGVVTTVNVKVTPEGGTKFEQTYVLRIRRELPSTDARLQSLVVNGGENMTPVPFIPAHTTYNVNIPEGTPGYTITAVPVEPHATITIDGKAVENGQPSQNIVSTTGNSRIRIVVTAQDGRTTKTYTLNVRDYNLIKKGSDATLSSLDVNYGDLQPSFRPNRENYELYVKPDAMGLDLTPELSDGRATMKVYSGTRQLTAYDGVYSGSLIEEENVFTIDVTAEDGKTTSSYTLTVYKNDEEKQGHMKPISADVVDFSENPIVIDITNYAVIDASVFNTLKVDYPDKTIIFQGNDYTLQLRGTDIAGLVPYNETYDLKLLFTTPEENQIRDALWDLNADPRQYLEDLEPVFIYFDDHTALPGKMLLTVHLGRAYSNDRLYWNYYNSERDRLDYYGYVRSNAQGSFSVAINHFSTYIITKERIIGAESKVGLTYGGAPSTATGAADGSAGGDPNKVNPQTGVQTGGSE